MLLLSFSTFVCDEYYNFIVPKCKKDKCSYKIESKETAYIQQLIIEEFLEEAKYSSPIVFNAEITDKEIGAAFMGQRKTLLARFRSIPDKSGRNVIVFDIDDMKDINQVEGCLPTDEELERIVLVHRNRGQNENWFPRPMEVEFENGRWSIKYWQGSTSDGVKPVYVCLADATGMTLINYYRSFEGDEKRPVVDKLVPPGFEELGMGKVELHAPNRN